MFHVFIVQGDVIQSPFLWSRVKGVSKGKSKVVVMVVVFLVPIVYEHP